MVIKYRAHLFFSYLLVIFIHFFKWHTFCYVNHIISNRSHCQFRSSLLWWYPCVLPFTFFFGLKKGRCILSFLLSFVFSFKLTSICLYKFILYNYLKIRLFVQTTIFYINANSRKQGVWIRIICTLFLQMFYIFLVTLQTN